MYNDSAHACRKQFNPKTIDVKLEQVPWVGGHSQRNRSQRPIPDVIRRDTGSWLSDLQEVCEKLRFSRRSSPPNQTNGY